MAAFLDATHVRLIEQAEAKFGQINCEHLEGNKAQCVGVQEEMKKLAEAMTEVRKLFHSCKELELQNVPMTKERDELMQKCLENFQSAYTTTVASTYQRLSALGLSHN